MLMTNNNRKPIPPLAPSWKPTETDAQRFGRRVAHLRSERGMTQMQLAIMTGRDRSFLSSVENGAKEPALTTMRLLADAFEISLSELLNGI